MFFPLLSEVYRIICVGVASTDSVSPSCSVCKHLVELLCEGKYPEAVALFLTAGETWPNEDVFKYKRDGEKEEDEEEEEDGDDGAATCVLRKLGQLVLGMNHFVI